MVKKCGLGDGALVKDGGADVAHGLRQRLIVVGAHLLAQQRLDRIKRLQRRLRHDRTRDAQRSRWRSGGPRPPRDNSARSSVVGGIGQMKPPVSPYSDRIRMYLGSQNLSRTRI